MIIGSLSILGTIESPPADMVMSIDVDMYPLLDPGRAFDIVEMIGQGSEFEEEYGYYADPVSPNLPSLPVGWERRLVRIEYPDAVVGLYLDPNDAAVSKYARLEPRDRAWLRSGLKAALLDPDVIQARMGSATYAGDEELTRAREALSVDRLWLSGRA